MATKDVDVQSDQRQHAMDMAGLGPIALLVLLGMSATFSGATADGVGYAAGRFASSLLLALPVYALVRYGTQAGRRLSAVRCLNLLCLLEVPPEFRLPRVDG